MKEINQVKYICYITIGDATKYSWLVGLVSPGSTPGQALLPTQGAQSIWLLYR